MSMEDRPIEMAVDTEVGVLRMTWEDGHVGAIPFEVLRGACPCAVCKGGHRAADPRNVRPVPGARLLDVLPVGAYAYRMMWADGHRSGLYRYGYLRALC